MSPVAYIELVSALACLAAAVFIVRGWKRPGFLRAVPVLLLLLALLMMFYALALCVEWSGLAERLHWHVVENFASIFIPAVWAFVFYAFVKNAVEADLRASRKHFRDLVEFTNDWLWEVDAGGHYIYASPHIEAILGYKPEEVLGKTPFDLMVPAEAERLTGVFAEFAASKKPFQDLVNINRHKDGRTVILETNGTPILDEQGRLLGYRGVDRDISARIEAESVRKRQQAELDSIFNASPAGVGLVRNRYLVRGNARFFEITGYPEKELVGMDPRALYQTDKDYFDVGDKYGEAMRNGFARIETKFVRKDGTPIDVVIYLSPLDRNNADAGFVVVTQNITEIKAARREALAERTRAQLYLDVADVMILVLDAQGCVQLLNKKGYEILECESEQVLGVDWFNHFLPSSYQQISRNAFARILQGDEKAVAYIESPICTPDGTEKLIAWRNASLRDESGKVIGVVSSGQDITEARAAEEALRESDERLRIALSAAKMGSWRWQVTTDEDVRDAGLNAILGLPAEETTQSKEDFFQYVHPDDRQKARNECERAITKRDSCRIEFRIVRKDGTVRWVLDQGKPFYDFNGQLEYMTGVLVDITERHEAEELIRESRDSLQREMERFESMFHTIPECIYMKDMESRFTHVNDAWLKRVGLTDEKGVLGKTDFDIFTEEHAGRAFKDEQEIIRTGIPKVGYEEKETWPDGHITWCMSTKMPLRDVKGEIVGLLGISHNITERKQAQQQREELLNKLQFTQFAVDHASDAAYWIGADAKFIYANDQSCQSLGYTREELLELSVPDIDPDFPAEIWPQHWEHMRKEPSMRFESHHKTKDGRVFPVEITANFVEYDGEEYICAFARNITERKVAEQHRQLMNQQLENRNEEMQSIVFTAAHDLRSPLVNIAGFTGELEKGLKQLTETLDGVSLDAKTAERIDFLLKADIPESLKFVKYGNQQMDMLLGGLMRLSRVGSASIKPITLDMNQLLNAVVRGFQYQVKTLDLEISVDEDLPNCTGDYSLLAQVFINLLDNAIKYRREDCKTMIRLGGVLLDDEVVEYSVADNGIGIEPDELAKVFDLFHQLHNKPDTRGEGLGLTIVRRIMDRQNGSVRIESTPGTGTTVFVQLPKA